MVWDVTVMVTISDGAGILLLQQSLNHQIVFFILSRSSMVGVVSWHPILLIVGIATATETKKKTSKSKTKTILFSIIGSVIYQIKGDKSTRTLMGLSSSMPMSPQPLQRHSESESSDALTT
ncbi:uncharacterized protein LOC131301384 [Rhododendron vialii]|uniref:uncharacterized protein LOC131301384 n=1 Tax=Rhododendron vialii TaxID=182163 RepID=UPI00265F7BA0|nr:uncharacterized protein LOC131301384 [Rhododendron vialii]